MHSPERFRQRGQADHARRQHRGHVRGRARHSRRRAYDHRLEALRIGRGSPGQSQVAGTGSRAGWPRAIARPGPPGLIFTRGSLGSGACPGRGGNVQPRSFNASAALASWTEPSTRGTLRRRLSRHRIGQWASFLRRFVRLFAPVVSSSLGMPMSGARNVKWLFGNWSQDWKMLAWNGNGRIATPIRRLWFEKTWSMARRSKRFGRGCRKAAAHCW